MKTVLMSDYRSSGIGKSHQKLMKVTPFNIGRREADIVLCYKIYTLEREVKTWLKSHEVDVLHQLCGCGLFDPHESISPLAIKKLIDVNLTALLSF